MNCLVDALSEGRCLKCIHHTRKHKAAPGNGEETATLSRLRCPATGGDCVPSAEVTRDPGEAKDPRQWPAQCGRVCGKQDAGSRLMTPPQPPLLPVAPVHFHLLAGRSGRLCPLPVLGTPWHVLD